MYISKSVSIALIIITIHTFVYIRFLQASSNVFQLATDTLAKRQKEEENNYLE